jgi:hypothetical protein
MYLFDDLGACDAQQIVIALQITRMINEACTAKVGLLEFVALNHSAHGTVEDDDFLGCEFL